MSSNVEYREVRGFPGYRVGTDGTVWTKWQVIWSSERQRLIHDIGPMWRQLKPGCASAGRPLVVLFRDGKAKPIRVCRLVLEVFVGPCPRGMEACHFPERDPANNHLSNLRWDTRKANNADAIKHGTKARGEKVAGAKLTDAKVAQIKQLLARGFSWALIAQQFAVVEGTIRFIAIGKTWKHIA